jgi:ABC-type amino acid transport substrate-binding protein
MKMKKLFTGAAALFLAVSLVACGGSASETTKKIESADDLSGAKIGAQTGTTGAQYIQGDIDDGVLDPKTTKLEQYNKGADAIQALKQGKIDAVIIDNEPAKAFVAENSDLKILDTPYTEEDYAICISKDNPELTAAFNKAIAEIKSEGILDAILDKYINKTEGAKGYVTPEGTEHPNGELVMATNAYFPPYEYYEGKEIVGIDVEFATAICDKLGYTLKVEDMEFDSIIAAIQSGKADFGAAGMTVDETRKKSVDFTDSYCTGIQVIVVKK